MYPDAQGLTHRHPVVLDCISTSKFSRSQCDKPNQEFIFAEHAYLRRNLNSLAVASVGFTFKLNIKRCTSADVLLSS